MATVLKVISLIIIVLEYTFGTGIALTNDILSSNSVQTYTVKDIL